jgi:hypothetical protein
MYGKRVRLKYVVAAILLIGALSPAAAADEATLDALYDQLKAATPEEAEAIEAQIWDEWSQSGSAAMDLLLERGREAMEAEDPVAAIDGGPWADQHRQDPLRHRADAGAPHRRDRPAAAPAGARGL